ncbi:MAG: hypothetical protein Q9165_005016 [Trypethelium subeluteriae]
MNGAGRSGPGRNGTLSPISTVSSESTLVSKYQQLNGADNPYSPGLSSASYGDSPLASPPASSDGRMSNAMRGRMGNGNPSPPSSVARSSDGNGLYSAGMSQEAKRERAARLEEALQEHYAMLKGYLASQLRGDLGARPNKARDKLLRLSMGQFEELSTDVYDELRRREDMRLGRAKNVPRFLLPIKDFHPKRNQARQKLASLPPDRFRQLATDVFYELERRFPRFSGRPGSPALSIASSKGGRSGPGSMGPPRGSSRAGERPPPSYRPSPPGSSGPGMSSPEDDFGKPLPKQFQQNTIVPNKSTMVEDESGEEEGEPDLYDMSRSSKPSVKSGNSSEYQGQISQLESKVDELEAQLREKDAEMQKLRSSHSEKEDAAGADRAEWDDMRGDLEQKLADAQTLNESIQSELERFRTDSTNTERELRVQLEEAREAQATKGFDEEHNNQGEWQQRYETLQQELYDQDQIIDEVRREAKQYLAEMRTLTTQSSDALESESRLIAQVHSLEAELQDWKTRYAKARTQLRHLRTSSLGLASQPLQQAGHLARDDTLVAADGLVADVHVTRFQLAVDELLATARQPEGQGQRTLDAMKGVVMATRAITADCDAGGIHTPTSAGALVSPEGRPEAGAGQMTPTSKNPSRLKGRVSATANNLITAAKNHAGAQGLAPVSLLDAAASHLVMGVVELVRVCRVRSTGEGEEGEDGWVDVAGEGEGEGKVLPRTPNSFGEVKGMELVSPRRGLGMGGNRGSDESGEYSATSTSSPGRRNSAWGRSVESRRVPDAELEDLKLFIDEQTAILVRSIQPLVSTIRAASASPTATLDLATIQDHVADIATTVEDIVNRSSDAMRAVDNPAALEKHAAPVLRVLEECRAGLLDASEDGNGVRAKVPGLAFKIARGTKELVHRVKQIESGELTERQDLPNEI